ncbi:helix-turn-helix domain-containing protein [Streptomyces purpureus]|uniref:Transcriptional regulator n=1 Tax=Streptomyces purpureus TaxID=1951 RepID=A0A918LPW4_9ACTN|nr:helix-turn-helix transcriptional regulator [Streptomyces purpureus]GGT35310.1 transcriptional regulator [Streptomyces purpureus]
MPPRRVITGRSQEPRKRFAEELRLLRTERGESLRRLGETLGWDWSLFGKMENGETVGGPEVVQALDTYYGTPGLLLALWELAVGDQTQFREKYRQYMALEAKAVSLWHYAASVLPGLLQTEAYARTLMETGLLEGEELDRQVKARIGRQELLSGPNALGFRTILSETTLRTPLPDPAQWQEQLEHLLAVGDRRNVTIQVVPHSAGLYALNGTHVTFLRLADGRVVAWVETSYSGNRIDGTTDVDLLQLRYDRARDLALSPADSRKFIMQTLEEAQCEPSI